MDHQLLFRYRLSLALFVTGLVLSGVTAFPLQWELDVVSNMLGASSDAGPNSLGGWITFVCRGLHETYDRYPFIGYGTDWLAFGHLIIALFFIGPWRDPQGNAWVLRIGLVACAAVVPLALICGAVRGIPIYWRLIDCSFGVFGSLPLFYCLRQVALLKKEVA